MSAPIETRSRAPKAWFFFEGQIPFGRDGETRTRLVLVNQSRCSVPAAAGCAPKATRRHWSRRRLISGRIGRRSRRSGGTRNPGAAALRKAELARILRGADAG